MRALGKVAVSAIGALSVSNCLDATEITVRLSTDVSCSAVEQSGVAIAVGNPGDESSGVATVARSCDGGDIGSIVLVPSGDLGESIGIRASLGVGKDSATCTIANPSGCVIARRSLRFSPHQPLDLPISLQQSCLGQPCDPNSTCVNGACVDAGSSCSGGSCNIADAGPSCVPFGPVTVASSVAARPPHIAKTTGGYFVAWEAVAGELHGVTVSESGAITAPDVNLLTIPASGGVFGPVASDGTSYAVGYSDPTSPFLFRTWSPQGTLIAGPTGFGPGGLPLSSGILWDGARYLLATTANGSSVTFDYAATSSIGPATTTPITRPGATNVSLARGAPDALFVTMTDGGSCFLYACTYDGTNVTCPVTTLPTFIVPSCSVMRGAAIGTSYFTAAFVPIGIQTSASGQAGPTVNVTPDDVAAFELLATGSTFRLVWESGGIVSSMDVPTSKVASQLSPTATGYPQYTGAGFASVADGPTTGYAVAYWDQSNLKLIRRCN